MGEVEALLSGGVDSQYEIPSFLSVYSNHGGKNAVEQYLVDSLSGALLLTQAPQGRLIGGRTNK